MVGPPAELWKNGYVPLAVPSTLLVVLLCTSHRSRYERAVSVAVHCGDSSAQLLTPPGLGMSATVGVYTVAPCTGGRACRTG